MIGALHGFLVEAWQELRIHKLCVLLSLVGVAIAVCSLTLVVAMSTMEQDSLRASYEQMSGRADTLLIEPDHGTIFSTELVAGRWFAPGDEQNLAPAAVVNENVLEDQGLTASDLPASIELAATEGAAPVTATIIGVTPGNQWDMREVRLLAGARVFFSVMMESVVATSLAGVVGIAVSVLILRTPAVMAILTDGMAAAPAFPVSAALVGFAVSVGAGALAGLLPAIVATRARIVDAIRA